MPSEKFLELKRRKESQSEEFSSRTGDSPDSNKIVVPNAVQRRKGYLYYIDREGNLCEAMTKQEKRKNEISR